MKRTLQSISVCHDGGILLLGEIIGQSGMINCFHPGFASTDIWVIKIDSSGNILWQKCLGGSGNEIAYSIAETSDNGIILTGKTNSTDGDVTGNHGGYDLWVVKLQDPTTGIEQSNTNSNGITIYEHSGYLIIRSINPEEENMTCRILNLQEQIIKESNVSISKGINYNSIDVSEVPFGLYFIQLISDGEVYSQKIIIH